MQVSKYIAKAVILAKPLMKVRSFDPKHDIFITGFLATFRLASNINRIRDGAGMCVLAHYVN